MTISAVPKRYDSERVLLDRETLRRKVRKYANRMADDLLDDVLRDTSQGSPELAEPAFRNPCMGWNRVALVAAMAELKNDPSAWYELITHVWTHPQDFEADYKPEGDYGLFFVPRDVVDMYFDTAHRRSLKGLTRETGVARAHQIQLGTITVASGNCWLIARCRNDKNVARGVQVTDLRSIWI